MYGKVLLKEEIHIVSFPLPNLLGAVFYTLYLFPYAQDYLLCIYTLYLQTFCVFVLLSYQYDSIVIQIYIQKLHITFLDSDYSL